LGTVALGIGRVAKTKHHSSGFSFSRRYRKPTNATPTLRLSMLDVSL